MDEYDLGPTCECDNPDCEARHVAPRRIHTGPVDDED